jgi:hypothetical protein
MFASGILIIYRFCLSTVLRCQLETDLEVGIRLLCLKNQQSYTAQLYLEVDYSLWKRWIFALVMGLKELMSVYCLEVLVL